MQTAAYGPQIQNGSLGQLIYDRNATALVTGSELQDTGFYSTKEVVHYDLYRNGEKIWSGSTDINLFILTA